jgi:hypothetical protein
MRLHRNAEAPDCCPRGHPYSGDNLYIWNGHRRCRECIRQAGRRWRAKRREMV